jgi:lysyl-tRNA synthetase class 1
MHWADVVANKLIKQEKKHVLATGITPSGPIHIGNMREVLTTDAIYRALIDKGADAELIYIADNYDHLRKVYPFLPGKYEKYVGKPLAEIPCPCGKHKNYSEHFLEPFLKVLDQLGIHPKIYRAYEMYKEGKYQKYIQIAMDNTDKLKEIIEKISKRDLPKNWVPFNIQCEKCGRLTTTKPILYNYPYIEYFCECGHTGEVDIRKNGVGKLPWRVDWPARWKMLNVTFEAFGKDHAAAGSSWDTGKVIVKEIYDYPPPEHLVYEFIHLKGKGAMHGSTGTAFTAEDMLNVTPPEVLRFLIMKNQPNKHIEFDPGLGILNLVDEYDRWERVYFNVEERIPGMKDLKRTYELSQPKKVPEKIPCQIPYRHMVTLIQIAKNWNEIKKILIRTNQIPENIGKDDEKLLKSRAEHAKYWVNNFAPDIVKFEIMKKLPKDIKLTKEQKVFLKSFHQKLLEIEWDAEEIHKSIYSVAEEIGIDKNVAFKSIYQILLGKDRGPRAGYFLSSLDKKFVLKQIEKAISQQSKHL